MLMSHAGTTKNSFIHIYLEDQNLFNAFHGTVCYCQYLMQKLTRTEISKSASLSTTYSQIMQVGDFFVFISYTLSSVLIRPKAKQY